MMERFMRLLDDLHQKVSLMPSFRWAVVESVSPLRIRYETEAVPVAGTPDTLVAGLQPGDRVWCMRIHRRDIVLGRGKGLPDYSTGEITTGRNWIDGKTIYARTVTGTITQSGGSRHSTSLLPNNTVDTLISSTGYFTGSDGNRYALSQVSGNDSLSIVYHFSYIVKGTNGNVGLLTRSDNARSNASYAVYLEYTKL